MNRLLVLLFGLATAYTVGRVGILYASAFVMAQGGHPDPWSADSLLLSLWYTLPLLGILLAHEGGHLLMARRYRVSVAGPFLLPLPLGLPIPLASAFGTAGAMLRFKAPPPSDEAAWDIAATGVLAGAVLSTACILLGGWWSVPPRLRAVPMWMPSIMEWTGADHVAWHPIVAAGWVGWILTAINLIPIRPFDGGVLLDTVPAAWRSRRWSVCAVAIVVVLCLA